MFNFFSTESKIAVVRPPADVLEAFAKYGGSTTEDQTTGDVNNDAAAAAQMSADQLRRFLMEYQEENESRAQSESERIVHQVFQREGHGGLTVDKFFQYLFDDDLNGPVPTEVHHDMTAPLHHYFIYTSHNSYLTGNQLSSDCSDMPIIEALQRGVRVIELDLWPNSSEDDIDVVHGWTLTTPVSLMKCLTSIRNHAFEKSPYPLIITLEDHLTPDLQAKVAKMVTEIFGDVLYYPDSNNLEEFPSPEDLKHRILLSTKPPKEYLDSTPSKSKQDTSLSKKDSSGDDNPSPPQEGKAGEQSPEDDSDTEEVDGKSSSNRHKSAPEYKRLIAIRAGKPKNGLIEALRSGLEKVRRLSLSEEALEDAVENYATDVVRFTQKNFLRIYPKGTRIGSSNYEPVVAWTHGAQMVALNMQGCDKALWLVHGMFRANGGCGFIKKPSFLLNNEPHLETNVFDPKAALGLKTTLKVRVYMGDGWYHNTSQSLDFDADSTPDFYTKLRLVGIPADCDKKKTKVIKGNWVPIWDEEFSFNLTLPELALLRFEVREYNMLSKDEFGGQTCLPVSEIKPGIRAVPLFDKKGEKLPNVKLLVRFQFVPNSSL